MENKKEKNREEKFEKLTLADTFFFGEVMNDEKTSKDVLEIILGIEIEKIVLVDKEKHLDNVPKRKSIRMDIYVKDDRHTVYNIEMQVDSRKDIPQRSRYYQGMMDTKELPSGSKDYRELKDGYIIFICQFDPFGQKKCYYTFEERCVEDLNLALEDGTKKIFLNTKGKNRDEMSGALLDLLDFIRDPEHTQLHDERVKAISNRTKKLKRDAEVRERYMTLMNWIDEEADKARAKGYAQGMEAGMEAGLQAGREEMNIAHAQKMLLGNMEISLIMEITELSKEKVEQLKQEMIQNGQLKEEG